MKSLKITFGIQIEKSGRRKATIELPHCEVRPHIVVNINKIIVEREVLSISVITVVLRCDLFME